MERNDIYHVTHPSSPPPSELSKRYLSPKISFYFLPKNAQWCERAGGQKKEWVCIRLTIVSKSGPFSNKNYYLYRIPLCRLRPGGTQTKRIPNGTNVFKSGPRTKTTIYTVFRSAACGGATKQRETFHLPSNLFAAPPPPGPQTNWKASGRWGPRKTMKTDICAVRKKRNNQNRHLCRMITRRNQSWEKNIKVGISRNLKPRLKPSRNALRLPFFCFWDWETSPSFKTSRFLLSLGLRK